MVYFYGFTIGHYEDIEEVYFYSHNNISQEEFTSIIKQVLKELDLIKPSENYPFIDAEKIVQQIENKYGLRHIDPELIDIEEVQNTI